VIEDAPGIDESCCNTEDIASLVEWANRAEKWIFVARELLEAVECTHDNGPVCNDVRGKNWHDTKDRLLDLGIQSA